MEKEKLDHINNSLKRLNRLTPADHVLLSIKRELGIQEPKVIPLNFLRLAAAVFILLVVSNIYFLNSNTEIVTLASDSLINDYTLYGS